MLHDIYRDGFVHGYFLYVLRIPGKKHIFTFCWIFGGWEEVDFTCILQCQRCNHDSLSLWINGSNWSTQINNISAIKENKTVWIFHVAWPILFRPIDHNVMTCECFLHYWQCARGIYRKRVEYPLRNQWSYIPQRYFIYIKFWFALNSYKPHSASCKQDTWLK